MRNTFRALAAVIVLVVGSRPVAAGTRISSPDHPVARALAFFKGSEVDGGEALIAGLRPSALSPTLRAAVIAALPPEGELEPTPSERTKIAALDPIFALHDRRGVVVTKVIDVGHAFFGLHARSVLLLSRDALSLLDTEELHALAAHELAHELFWDQYQEARARGAHDVTRELELRCDGVAVATLRRLGRGPESLVDGVVKMTRYNEAIGAIASAPNYVFLEHRRQFIRDVAALLGANGNRGVSRRTP